MSNNSPATKHPNRVHSRVTAIIAATVHLESKKTFRGEVKNISQGGAMLITSAPLAKGQKIAIELFFSRLKTAFGTIVEPDQIADSGLVSAIEMAEVRWSEPPTTYGVQFTNLTSQTKKFLKVLVKHFENIDEDMSGLE